MAPLPLVRQRENALLYVRGLVEHGGRKSLQPTLFRLEETPARYESMQQFLADSPWDPELLVRACAERVAPEIGVVAWVVDDTGIVKDGKHSPGVKRQYSGTLGKIGNCQITVSVHAVGRARDAAAGLAAVSARGVVRRLGGGARRRSRTRSASRRSRELAGGVVQAGGRLGDPGRADARRRAPTATTPLPHRAARAGARVRARRARADRASTGRRRLRRSRAQRHGRPAADGRPARPQARVGARARRRLPARAWQTLPCRTTPAGEDVASRFAFVRVVATHPVRNDHQPPR